MLSFWKHPNTQIKLGFILAILGTGLFSFKSIVVKLAYEYQIVGEQLIALRMMISAPIYLAILWWLNLRNPISVKTLNQHKWLLLVAGLMGYYLASLLDLWGLELISAQLERLILFTYPGFVMLLSLVIWKKVPSKITMLSLFITYLGIAVVLGVEAQKQWSSVLLGGGMVLLSAFFFGLYLILSKTGIQALGSQRFTCIAMLVASTAVAIHMSFLRDLEIANLAWQVYALALALAIFCTVIPSLLIAAAIARLGPQLTSILGGLGPVMTAIFAVFILNEPFGVSHLLGTSLVVVGAWLVAYEARRAT